jgi:hypothetical protein
MTEDEILEAARRDVQRRYTKLKRIKD